MAVLLRVWSSCGTSCVSIVWRHFQICRFSGRTPSDGTGDWRWGPVLCLTSLQVVLTFRAVGEDLFHDLGQVPGDIPLPQVSLSENLWGSGFKICHFTRGCRWFPNQGTLRCGSRCHNEEQISWDKTEPVSSPAAIRALQTLHAPFQRISCVRASLASRLSINYT